MITDKEVVDDFSSFYNSGGRHPVKVNGVNTKAYRVWRCMTGRCYKPRSKNEARNYADCFVSKEWQDFQGFADWYNSHEFKDLDYHLDKDILVLSNKIYSPDFCSLVPREINALFNDCKNIRGNDPQGVHFFKLRGKFKAKISRYGKQCHLGTFNTAIEAYDVYKKAKEDYVKSVAKDWAKYISKDVFSALMQWELSDISIKHNQIKQER